MAWHGLVVASALIVLSAWLQSAQAQSTPTPSPSFAGWMGDFRARALAKGIPPAVVDDALNGLEPDPQVIALDQKQPEGKISYSEYLRRTVTPHRVRVGRELYTEYRGVLERIGHQYHVPPQYLLALWGIESDYGSHSGDFSVVQSLATLSYEGRRADFFADELIEALRIASNERRAPIDLSGSWAGAMGGCQFMPSTYLKYAADGDNDGQRDIWQDPADVFASTANYLNALGWDKRIGWGHPVAVPDDFTPGEADIHHARTVADWSKRGLTEPDGSPLPPAPILLYAIYPGTPDEGALLVTENFQALLQWNRSRYFAAAVGTLADRIAE